MPAESRVARVVLAVAGALAGGCVRAEAPAPMPMLCFPAEMSRAQMDAAMLAWGMLPPGLFGPDVFGGVSPRYAVTSSAWNNNGLLGAPGTAVRANLTFSFVPDGAAWVSGSTGPVTTDMFALLAAQFGSDRVDFGLELMRSAFASWRASAGLTFHEVPDDGASAFAPYSPDRGVIRVAGAPYGGETFLGFAFPPDTGGDVTMNTSYFLGNFGIPDNKYRFLRNATMHEIGHGLGLIHVTPCEGTKLMEPRLLLSADGPTSDDLRGIQRQNGDIFSGNRLQATATPLGEFGGPKRTVRHRNLSTNGASLASNENGEDWFAFTLSAPTRMRLSASPVQGVYRAGRQTLGCDPIDPPVMDISRAGTLRLDVFPAGGAMMPGTPPTPGEASTFDATLPAGSYTFRVQDTGPNDPVNQLVQLYDLTVASGGAPDAPSVPVAIAGVDKVIAGVRRCFFLGDINSRATDPGAALSDASYDWDLDGDGVFEVVGNPRPTALYLENRVFHVKLRVTDSLGSVATDAIDVTVVDVPATVTSIAPGRAGWGPAVPLTILGSDLGFLRSPAQITVSGGGVQVWGNPVVEDFGGTLRGMNLRIPPGQPGMYELRVEGPDGEIIRQPLRVDAFPYCPGDADGSLLVDVHDLGVVVAQFGQTGFPGSIEGDVTGDGRVDFADLVLVLANYGRRCD